MDQGAKCKRPGTELVEVQCFALIIRQAQYPGFSFILRQYPGFVFKLDTSSHTFTMVPVLKQNFRGWNPCATAT